LGVEEKDFGLTVMDERESLKIKSDVSFEEQSLKFDKENFESNKLSENQNVRQKWLNP
jgi:hypothetical protein